LQFGIKIGSDCEYGGLYYLNDGTFHSGLAAFSPSDTLLQWHHTLEYLSLEKLR